MSSGAAAAVIAIQAAEKRKREQEEEESKPHTGTDMDTMEFKILRSAASAFGDSVRMKEILAEEAQNGWVFVEKFDNNRIRLRRNISHRVNDEKASIDPYRTTYGISDWQIALIIIVCVCALMGFFIMFAILGSVH